LLPAAAILGLAAVIPGATATAQLVTPTLLDDPS
jgi:hypothetical protein